MEVKAVFKIAYSKKIIVHLLHFMPVVPNKWFRDHKDIQKKLISG